MAIIKWDIYEIKYYSGKYQQLYCSSLISQHDILRVGFKQTYRHQKFKVIFEDLNLSIDYLDKPLTK